MKILLLTSLVLLVAFLITQFLDKKHYKALKIVAIFGILVGCIALVMNVLINPAEVAVKPITVQAKNLSNEDLTIYALSFGTDTTSKTNEKVIFEKEVRNTTTESFSVDSESASEIWIVAKTKSNVIKLVNELNIDENSADIVVNQDQVVDAEKAQTAREIIFAKDVNQSVKNFAMWSNIVLILLLIWSIFRMNKYQKEKVVIE
ncbi:MAG: hypothetical protein ACOH1O_00275 [Flavobacterium sp.]